MLVDVLDALPLIGEPERAELLIAVLLAIIFAPRDEWCDGDSSRTKIRSWDGGIHRVSRRVDNRERTDGDWV